MNYLHANSEVLFPEFEDRSNVASKSFNYLICFIHLQMNLFQYAQNFFLEYPLEDSTIRFEYLPFHHGFPYSFHFLLIHFRFVDLYSNYENPFNQAHLFIHPFDFPPKDFSFSPYCCFKFDDFVD